MKHIPAVRIIGVLLGVSAGLNLFQLDQHIRLESVQEELAYKYSQALVAFEALKNYSNLVISGYEEECGDRSDAPKPQLQCGYDKDGAAISSLNGSCTSQ